MSVVANERQRLETCDIVPEIAAYVCRNLSHMVFILFSCESAVYVSAERPSHEELSLRTCEEPSLREKVYKLSQ